MKTRKKKQQQQREVDGRSKRNKKKRFSILRGGSTHLTKRTCLVTCFNIVFLFRNIEFLFLLKMIIFQLDDTITQGVNSQTNYRKRRRRRQRHGW